MKARSQQPGGIPKPAPHAKEALDQEDPFNPSDSKFAEAEWPDPEPLHVELRPVAKLRPEMIPEPLRPWITDIAHRMQCPLDFVAAPAVCMTGSAIGAGCAIRPKERDNWSVVPNLWGCVVGRPGTMKSPAIEEAFRPLKQLEHRAQNEQAAINSAYEAETAAYKAQLKALEAQMHKAAKNGGDMDTLKREFAALKCPEKPSPRRFMTTDTTIEKASEIMEENPRGLAIVRDELVGLLVVWDREDRRTDRCFHLQGWNGYGAFISDRIGRGTIFTPQLCEVIFGGSQPSKLYGYLGRARNNIENDGLIQRFQLLVHPDEPVGDPVIVDEYPDQKAKDRAFAIIAALAEMDFTEHGAEADDFAKIPYFHFSPTAQEFFNEWFLRLKTRQQNDDEPVMSEHLSKYPKLMPALALIFHLVELADKTVTAQDPVLETPQKTSPWADQVSLHCAKLAAEWCDYLETHARGIYGLATDTVIQGARRLLRKIKDGVLNDGFSARDVYRQCWTFLDTKEQAGAALDELVETGWLREIPPPKPNLRGGRPFTPTYQIHPRVCEILKKEKTT